MGEGPWVAAEVGRGRRGGLEPLAPVWRFL